ncbi:MAG: GNAT family N-acetyltransferase [Candidatus Heimdallarchaeaceae archaeon]
MQLEFKRLREENWKSFEEIESGSFPEDMLSKDDFIKFTENEGFVGAFFDNELVGYLLLRTLGSYGHLNRIAVHPHKRRQGFGSKFMEFTLNYFGKRGCTKVGLYVETDNTGAIDLYRLYGFEISKEAWHYWISEDEIKKILEATSVSDRISLRELGLQHYTTIIMAFPEINKDETREHLSNKNRHLILGLFDGDELVIYARYNKDFGGARPFLCKNEAYFDKFVFHLMKHSPKRNYFRVTFENNRKLAKLLEKRGYKLHHHLWYMTREL